VKCERNLVTRFRKPFTLYSLLLTPSGHGDGLDGIWDVDELDIEIVVIGDPVAEGADPEPLSRIMAGGHVMDAVLGGLMHDPLGGFSGHVGIESGGHCLMELALSAAGHNSHRRHQPIATGKDLWLAIARLGDGCEEFISIDGLWEDPAYSGRNTAVHTETLEFFKSEPTSQLGGVAELEMSIQREVVGNQRNPVFDQDANPFSE